MSIRQIYQKTNTQIQLNLELYIVQHFFQNLISLDSNVEKGQFSQIEFHCITQSQLKEIMFFLNI